MAIDIVAIHIKTVVYRDIVLVFKGNFPFLFNAVEKHLKKPLMMKCHYFNSKW
jgi:hypothetical protein